MIPLFDIQPACCRDPLPPGYLHVTNPKHIRVLSFDPTIIYNRIGNLIDPYCRVQSQLSIDQIFPNPSKSICACGCGQSMTGRRNRYASDECGWSFVLYPILHSKAFPS